jgi:ferredoxin
MDPTPAAATAPAAIGVSGLAQLLGALQRRGYQLIGPTVRDGAITLGLIEKVEDLPAGWTDRQEPGGYRLERREDGAVFGHSNGQHSWKQFLHPPEIQLCELAREGVSFKVVATPAPPPRRAFVGVRACDLAAIRIQDRVLLEDRCPDAVYADHRRDVFILAVNCTRASGTCFCTSMEAGPRVQGGFDLALTELAGPEGHVFLAEAGSQAGREVLAEIEQRPASEEEALKAALAIESAAQQVTRRLDTSDLRRLLVGNLEHPEWERVAARCLACGNCTLVCPTCFCTNVEDTSGVTGARAERRRTWDSCFTESFSYIHGGSVRLSVKSRYRQWLTHKLATWVDQFGTFGCVGCGRCITWCPAAIDLTAEVAAIRGG